MFLALANQLTQLLRRMCLLCGRGKFVTSKLTLRWSSFFDCFGNRSYIQSCYIVGQLKDTLPVVRRESLAYSNGYLQLASLSVPYPPLLFCFDSVSQGPPACSQPNPRPTITRFVKRHGHTLSQFVLPQPYIHLACTVLLVISWPKRLANQLPQQCVVLSTLLVTTA